MKTLLSLDRLRETFFERAANYDLTDRFPHENFADLAEAGLHAATLPESDGGLSCGFEETSRLLAEIAAGCPSTALCLAMHYYTLAGLSKFRDNGMLVRVFDDIRNNGEYMTSFNQPNVMLQLKREQTQNSTRIAIRKLEDGYLINGVKPYVSGCERFKYFPIYGNQEDSETKLGITALMVTREDAGVRIEKAWQSTAMRGTLSHHVRLDNVFVPRERLIGEEGTGVEDTNELTLWSRLAISSVYQGIAKAAVDYILNAVKHKKDSYSQISLAFMPGVQFTLAELLIQLETASSQLLAFARQADEESRQRNFSDELFQKSLITKYYVTHTANETVYKAMQIEGMNALTRGQTLERLYRDVRAATFHQPGSDLLKELLAKKSLGLITLRNRWC
ncbi:acyl-CoA dehydrogenase family protein [Paenibacillaceae bacterium WGS1546]|uniref:acyl-CoA dehydrogenase family protein n=1 Tax=Cohnella sp. WGS1546 TaxID=3366810 RepID=UPI00372CFD5C